MVACGGDDSGYLVADVCLRIKDPVFRIYCLENFDLNNDDMIFSEEAQLVREMEIEDMPINSLAGIEYFRNLVQLSVEEIPVYEVDLSRNVYLRKVDFCGCENLYSIILPENLFEIGAEGFVDCNLSTITIPKGVKVIGEYAFAHSNRLTAIYCKPTTPPDTHDSILYGSDKVVIYVPRASVNAYKTASGWSYYADRIVGYDF